MRLIQICFGWHGMGSALAWIVAAIFCLASLRRPRRERAFAVALGLALLGYGLACWNSAWVGEVRLDRTDEIRTAQEAQQRLLIREEQARRDAGESTVRFAEDAPGESVSVAAYRVAGKQKRAVGKVDAASARLAGDALRDGATADGEAAVTLKLPEYLLATRLSRINRLLAGLVLFGVFGVAAGDYLRRFNQPRESYWPLPIAGPWMKTVSPGPLLVNLKSASAGELAAFLEQVARKGQTFAYFGDRVKASDLSANRLRLGRWGIWPLRLLTWGQPAVPRDWDFLVDAVWFGRYGVFISAADGAPGLSAFTERLAGRSALRATAAALPHLVCDLGSGVDQDLLKRLRRRCQETGVRLVLVEPDLP